MSLQGNNELRKRLDKAVESNNTYEGIGETFENPDENLKSDFECGAKIDKSWQESAILNERSAGTLKFRVPLQNKVIYVFRMVTFFTALTFVATVIVLNLTPSYILMKAYKPYRKSHVLFSRWLVQMFGSTAMILTALYAPCTIYCYGDWHELVRQNSRQSLETQKLIMMANHQMYGDWWYIWLLARQLQHHGDLKFILRSDLKRLPIFGWGMSMIEFIFMARKWITDGLNLYKVIRRVKLDKAPLWLVIFPEGTVITKGTIEKSTAFGQKMGIKHKPEYTLLPKTTGLHFISRVLQSGVHDLWDLTIGFSGVMPHRHSNSWPYDVYPISKVFFEGKGPREIHIFFRHFDTRRIPGVSLLKDETKIDHLLRVPALSASSNELYLGSSHVRDASGNSDYSVISRSSSPPGTRTSVNTMGNRFAKPHDVRSRNPTNVNSDFDGDSDFVKAESTLSQEFAEWLRDRFAEKDQLMRYFYRHGRFFDPEEATFTGSPTSPVASNRNPALKNDNLVVIPSPLPPAHIIRVNSISRQDVITVFYCFLIFIPYVCIGFVICKYYI